MWTQPNWSIPWLVVLGVTMVAAVTDCRSHRIPNILTGPAWLAGLCWACITGGWAGAGDALAGTVIAMAPFVLLFLFAGGGAGDAKLMGAIGAWLGVIGGTLVLGAVMIAGGVLSVVMIACQRNLRDVFANLHWIVDSLRTALMRRGSERGEYVLPAAEVLHTMPYGLAIFTGTCLALGGVWLWH